jgi:hypothetical protein
MLQHPAASGYLHTVQHNLGYESAHPTLADILAATDTITRCATEADQCTSVELAAAYVRKATKRLDPAKLQGIAARPFTYAPTVTPVPHNPRHQRPGQTGTEDAGRDNGKCTSPTCLP